MFVKQDNTKLPCLGGQKYSLWPGLKYYMNLRGLKNVRITTTNLFENGNTVRRRKIAAIETVLRLWIWQKHFVHSTHRSAEDHNAEPSILRSRPEVPTERVFKDCMAPIPRLYHGSRPGEHSAVNSTLRSGKLKAEPGVQTWPSKLLLRIHHSR